APQVSQGRGRRAAAGQLQGRVSTDPLLGEGYETHRIDLGADAEGPLVATLIHREAGQGAAARADRPPILLMHGWSDYVLDRGLMEHLGRRGHDVGGRALRKYGRSPLPGQTATAVGDPS